MDQEHSAHQDGPGWWRTYESEGLSPVLQGALDCFMEHGYHGTTIRQIADRIGLSVPGVYHYYSSKHDLLVAIMMFAMADLRARSAAALEEAGNNAVKQFYYLVECLVLFHAWRRGQAFIAFSEIRSLNSDARQRHIAARDEQQALMDEVVARGAADGFFGTPHPKEASVAVVTMCTGVAQWFHLGGILGPSELARRYQGIAAGAVGLRLTTQQTP